jgi:GDP-mannose 6-dehydrogenase
MRISIFGLGYVGAVSFGCLVRQGHDVIGVDVDGHKLMLLSKGISPVVEEGMPELIEEAMRSGRARVTSDSAEAIANSDISFVCVGTPSRRNGAHDLTALRHVCEQIGRAVGSKKGDHITVIRSTVAPGTTEEVLLPILEGASRKRSGSGLHVCFQPEFLREGVSIKDFENPPMTIVGGEGPGVDALRNLSKDLPCEFISTSIRTAEMVKFCCNAFHAVKVVFANEVGRLCHGLEMDGREVMSLLCQDTHLNISPAYLRPGFAFGGSCLPKDLRALISMSRDVAVELPLLASVLPSNETQIAHALEIILRTKQRRIGMIGVSFKGGTDDLRESPLLELAERLIGKGMDVRIYDPEVNLSRIRGSNKAFVEEAIPHIASIMTDDVERLIGECEVIVLGVRDSMVESRLRVRPDRSRTLVDLVGVPDVDEAMGQYHGICW